ncbi:UDP-glycosyltransferase 86A1-like [Sesamum indicum]|uniref:Glycosyltransferase n=1 Tax=Sesamum indicum TaxID=4182 RepID=A0A6I9T1Z8_SESIN|nr:UDP-glycosyltransferase 86A1-like [Sesamum indicum]
MGETHPRPHAIVFSYPFQGHITPTLNLATNLASRGFTITYVQLEFVHHTISKAHDGVEDVDFFVQARRSGLDMRYTTISDGFPLEFDRNLNFNEHWEGMVRDFPDRVDELVGSITRSDASAAAFFLVADTLYTWPAAIAKKHNLVNVSLWTGAATVFSINSHLNLLRENGHLPCRGNDEEHISYIPGVQSIRTKDLMPYIQDPDVVPVLMKIVVKAFEQVKNADFILCNTVQELEAECLSALNLKQPTYAIGPMNFFSDFTKTVVEKSLWPESDCTHWLSSKPPASVLYISFGSIVQINKQEIVEIAHGLLHSQVNFIWILRTTDALPAGFQDDVKDGGLIVPWCNQNAVLSSPAVGGFLTHCGWNSVLESIWSGVPMICYPHYVDQPTNRKLVVDDWKVGIDLCDGGRVTSEAVASKINILMRGKSSIVLREQIKKVSKIMRNAFETDGSSQRTFDQFVDELRGRLYARREDIGSNP